jgi:hypothetical protein
MNRKALAVLVAPLWVPLGFAPYAALYVFQFSARAQEWVAVTTLLSIVLAYASMLMVAMPVFIALRRHGWATAWTAIVLGIAITVGGWWLLSSSLGSGFADDPDFAGLTATGEPVLLSLVGAVGALVGLTAWAIGRPWD